MNCAPDDGVETAPALLCRRHFGAAIVLGQQFVDAAAFLVELGQRLAVERLAAGQADAQGSTRLPLTISS